MSPAVGSKRRSGTRSHPPLRPAYLSGHLHTQGLKQAPATAPSLRFEWEEFFGGDGRDFPEGEGWNQRLLRQLIDTRTWITHQRLSRRIRLSGERRLSATLAIGTTFSAVAGFVVDMEHRNRIWATDEFHDATTPPYIFDEVLEEGAGGKLVVTIGILKDISSEVTTYLRTQSNERLPALHLRGTSPIESARQANFAVQAIKNAIQRALSAVGGRQIELFYAGPSPLALFLAHRLNATAPIQCYEWVRPGVYLPTCHLLGRSS